MLPRLELLDDLVYTPFKIETFADNGILDDLDFPAFIVKDHARIHRLHP